MGEKRVSKEIIILLLSSFLVFVVFFFISLDKPYHADSYSYLNSVKNGLKWVYESRASFVYSLYLFYKLFGELSLKVEIVLFSSLLFFVSFLFFREYFDLDEKLLYFSLFAFFFLSPLFMTITHLKEDVFSLFFFFLALYFLKKKEPLSFLSIISFILALSSKEIAVIFSPIYFLFAFFEKGKNAIVFILLPVVLFAFLFPFAVKFYLRNLGKQEMGSFSFFYLRYSLQQVFYSLGVLFFFLPLAFYKRTNKERVYLFFSFLSLFVLLLNSTFSYRHLSWLIFIFPLFVDAIIKLFKTPLPVYLFLSYLVVSSFLSLFPSVVLRKTELLVFPKISFNVKKALSMDYCVYFNYNGFECFSHKPYATKEELSKLLSSLKGEYVVFPDFFSYLHKDEKRYLWEKVKERVVDAKLVVFEDYHRMFFGFSPVEYSKILEDRYLCSFKHKKIGKERVGKLDLDVYVFYSTCDKKRFRVYSFMGRVFPKIKKSYIFLVSFK